MLRPSPSWKASTISFLAALFILTALTWAMNPGRELDQDAPQYASLARNLADGQGYRDTWGPWGDHLSAGRMPAWPAVVALAMWVAPASWPDAAIIRYTDAFCLALLAASFAFLTGLLGVRSPWWCIAAGLAVALSPAMIFIAVSGMSEVLFALFAVLALIALLQGGSWRYGCAVFVGLASLVRSNFLITPIAFLALCCLFPQTRRYLRGSQGKHLLVLTILAMLPPFLWTVRNYQVTGRFPLVSALEGETLWGSNNPVTSGDLNYWGTWVFPDLIPSETPKLQLVKTLDEVQVSEYYHAQAMTWIKSHLPDLPRLILGKLVRAFAPIPWIPQPASYVAFGYRFLLYALLLFTFRSWWPRIPGPYLLFWLAVFASLLATTLIYYGNFRFTHCMIEIFFIPLIALGLERGHGLTAATVLTDDIVEKKA